MPGKFYSIDEAKAKLGMDENQIRGLVRDAKLREFRDGPKVNYKVEEVDKLAASMSGAPAAASADSGELVLEPVEEDVPPAAASGSGTAIPMAGDAGASDTGLISLEDTGTGHGDEVKLEDSTLPTQPGKDDTVITSEGVSVFDEEDLEIEADPMAKTVLTASASDQVALEGIGSGSGLLDLTREADDTSLGAVLEDIRAEDEPQAAATPSISDEPTGDAEYATAGGVAVAPVMVIDDPTAPVYTGLAFLGVLVMALCGAVTSAFVSGVWPGYLQIVYESFWIVFLVLLVVAFGVLGVGHLLCNRKPKRRK